MALLVAEYPHNQFGTLNNVYARIAGISWQDAPGAYINIYIYASQQARIDGKQPLDNYTIELPIQNVLNNESGSNVIADTYEFIKSTVDHFVNSVDV